MERNIIQLSPRFLWLLMLCYCMMLSLSNWFDAAPVTLFGKIITFGSIIYPFTFVFADIITYVYGYKFTILTIVIALICNVIFIACGQYVVYHLAKTGLIDPKALKQLLHLDFWVILASFSSYLISEPFNGVLIAKIKVYFQEYIGIAFLLSTLIASTIDSVLFVWIAFAHTGKYALVYTMMLHVWSVKLLVEILALPVAIRLTKKIIQIEKISISDKNTNFMSFSFNPKYSQDENIYKGSK